MNVFASWSRVWLSESNVPSWFSFRRGAIVFGCVSSSGLTGWKTVTVLTEVRSTSVLAAAQMYQDQLLGQQDTDLLLNYWCCPVCVCVWTSEKVRQRETVSERMSMCWPDPCCRFLSCGRPSAGRRLVGRIVRNVHSGKTQQEDLLQTGTVPWEVDQHFIWQADFTGPAGQVRYCRKVWDFLWCRWSYVMSMVKSKGYYHVRALTH